MKLNSVKRRLHESITRDDLSLWHDYCWNTHSEELTIYTIDDLPDLLYENTEMDPIDGCVASFWDGARAINVIGAKYLTYAYGRVRGLSEREVKDRLSDPEFLKWKRERAQSEN